jgi:hypothetical protein
VLAFLSLVFTILSLFAWNRPLTMGKLHIEPHEARMFIGRGLMAGAFAVLFLVLVDLIPDIAINWNYWLVYWSAGYVGGSIGLELLFIKSRTDAPVTDEVTLEQLPPPPISQRPRVEPVRFATWDDVRVPRDDGHEFHAKVGSHSTGSWAGLTGSQTA